MHLQLTAPPTMRSLLSSPLSLVSPARRHYNFRPFVARKNRQLDGVSAARCTHSLQIGNQQWHDSRSRPGRSTARGCLPDTRRRGISGAGASDVPSASMPSETTARLWPWCIATISSATRRVPCSSSARGGALPLSRLKNRGRAATVRSQAATLADFVCRSSGIFCSHYSSCRDSCPDYGW